MDETVLSINAQKVIKSKKGQTEEQGMQLAEAVIPEFDKEGLVTIDMSTLTYVRVKFFKAFMEKIHDKFPDLDKLDGKMVIEYTHEDDKDIMMLVIKEVYNG